jgi:hypothetical protein
MVQKILFFTFVNCCLSAQSGISIFAGLNRADISAATGSLGASFVGGNRSIEPDPDLGLRLGIEKKLGNWGLGLSFTQRNYLDKSQTEMTAQATGETGFSYDFTTTANIVNYVKMDYITLYGTYPIMSSKRGKIFAGLELGTFLNGGVRRENNTTIYNPFNFQQTISEFTEEAIDLTNVLSIEYGLLVGADLNISQYFSLRFSYYRGVSDIFESYDDFNSSPDIEEDEDQASYITDGQHRGIQAMLVYRL